MKEIIRNFGPWLQYLWRRFLEDECSRSAAALTYMSLFALVPLLTVMYAMLSAIPTFQGVGEQVQSLLFENLVPSTSAELEDYLADFSQQARNLSGIGIGFLLVTAVLMLRNVEATFNTIWRTRSNRSAIASFLLYWAVLSLGPLFIGGALGISTYLVSASVFFDEYDVIGIGGWLLKTAPVILSAAAFSLLYAAVPNCRVRFKHALLGGIITALVFNSARSLFTKAVMGSSYTAVYGAFAAFPLFLLWIYLSWNIVLGGGIVVHSLTSFRHQLAEARPLLIKALAVLHLLWLRQKEGRSLRESDLLDPTNPDTRGMDSDVWNTLREILLDKRILQVDEDGRYLLARDLHDVSYWQLKEWVNREMSLEELLETSDEGWLGEAERLLVEQRRGQRELMDISIAQLFQHQVAP